MKKHNNVIGIGLGLSFGLSMIGGSFEASADENNSPDFQKPGFDIPKLSQAPKIDGVLNPSEWTNAQRITDFVEYRPEVGDAPDHLIEAYVAYEANNFYVAATIHQPTETLVDRVLTQGGWIWREDYFGLVLDTNFDKSDGYLFHVTPSGVKHDGLINGSQYIGEWNSLWYAKTDKQDEYWSVEIAIPMQSMSFNPDISSWGLQLRHKKSEPYQEYYWNMNNTQDAPWQVHQLAEVRGISDITQGKGIEVRPSLSVRNNDDGTDSEPAVDLFYKLTSNLTGMLTLNTDFTGTEVDEQEVNLTRFNTYFAERRDFFLQDSQLFQFGGFDSLDYNGMPFYSRRLGLAPDGNMLDIDWGLKLSGQFGNTQLGVLSINQERAGDQQDSTQLSVMRAKQLITENHSIGAIVTDGSPDGNNSRTVGFDYLYNDVILGDQSIRAEAWYQDVSHANSNQDDTDAYGVNVEMPNDQFYFSGKYRYIGDNFTPALGFVSRNGIRKQDYSSFYRFRPQTGLLSEWLNYYQFFVRYDETTGVDGELQSRQRHFRPINFQTKDTDLVRLTFKQRTEVLNRPWSFSENIQFAAGQHDFNQAHLYIRTGEQRPVFATINANYGEYFSADLKDVYLNLHYSPNKHWYFNIGRGAYYYELEGEKYKVFRSHLKVNLAINAEWSWNNHIQHNTRSNQFTLFSRLHYQPAPDQLYQLSVNRGYDLTDGWHQRIETQDETALKFNAIYRW